MKLVKNILLIVALVLGLIFIKQKFFSKQDAGTQTEQVAPEATASEESAEPTTTAEAAEEQEPVAEEQAPAEAQ